MLDLIRKCGDWGKGRKECLFDFVSKRTGMLPDHIARCSKIQIWINKNKIQTIAGALSSSCEIPVLLNQPFAIIAAVSAPFVY